MPKTIIDFDHAIWSISSACDGKKYNYKGKQWEHHAIAVKALQAEGKDPKDLYVTKEPEPWENVERTIVRYCDDLLSNTVIDPFNLHLLVSGDKGHFRYDIATIQPYKGNRVQELPFHFKAVKDFIVDKYNAKRVYGVETDDAVGILYEDGDLIVSPDKDLDQLPGKHYNPQTKKEYEVNEVDALSNFYAQVITGDPGDSIPGLYGVGGSSTYVKAVKSMDNEVEMFALVSKLYEQRFGSYWKMFMLENCRLLWLIRNPNTFSITYWMEQLLGGAEYADFYFNSNWKGIIFSDD